MPPLPPLPLLQRPAQRPAACIHSSIRYNLSAMTVSFLPLQPAGFFTAYG